MTKSNLISEVWSHLNFPINKQKISMILECYVGLIHKELNSGNKVKIRNFGTFSLYQTKASKIKIPGKNNPVSSPSKTKIKFIPSHALKESVSHIQY